MVMQITMTPVTNISDFYAVIDNSKVMTLNKHWDETVTVVSSQITPNRKAREIKVSDLSLYEHHIVINDDVEYKLLHLLSKD